MMESVRSERRSILIAVAILFAAGLFLRAPFLDHPLIDLDEQFYMLVGERLWQGALPYVDIWDRKPFGLFLVFAAMHGLGGDGVLQYQLVAAACAIGTAAAIACMARPIAGTVAGIVGGLAYLMWLDLLGGKGGQSPVLYNLLTATAAACVLRAISQDGNRSPLRLGLAAMAAMGIAIQLKPTVVFEGVIFGLTLLALAWRAQPDARRLFGIAVAFVATALAPSALAFAYYWAIGRGEAFWYANVISIFSRNAAPHAPVWSNLGYILLILAPLGVAGAAGLISGRRQGDPRILFLALWSLASLIGLFAIKPYYNHYALPALVPLCVAASLGVARNRLWASAVLVAGCLWLNLAGFFTHYRDDAANARTAVAATTTIISRHLHGGCLWVFSGPPILYHSTNACLATRYAFPVHLNYLGEDGAIGVDSAAEVARTLAGRPAVITTYRGDKFVDRNPRTWPMVEAALRRDYVEVGQQEIFAGRLHIYARRTADSTPSKS